MKRSGSDDGAMCTGNCRMRVKWSTTVGPTLVGCADMLHVFSDMWTCLLHEKEQGIERWVVWAGHFQTHHVLSVSPSHILPI